MVRVSHNSTAVGSNSWDIFMVELAQPET